MTKPTNPHKYVEEDLPIGGLIVDHAVQRTALDPRKVEAMVVDFNPEAVGRVTVSRRKLGDQVVLDGWHRVEAVRRLTDNAGTIPARVFEGLTLQEEASLFLKLNTTNAPKYMDGFRVRVTRGDENAVRINEILNSFGWKVSAYGGDGHLTAIATLERIQKRSDKIEAEPDLVHSTILMVTKAWGHNYYGVAGPVMEGLARLLEEYGSQIDFGTLQSKLASYKGGPQSLWGQARQLAGLRRVRPAMAVADIIVNEYNAGRKKASLPSWRHRK
jgi:hypothetical protein